MGSIVYILSNGKQNITWLSLFVGTIVDVLAQLAHCTRYVSNFWNRMLQRSVLRGRFTYTCIVLHLFLLLTVPRRCFFWYVSRLFLWYCLVYSLQPCGQLLGKGWPLVCNVILCFGHLLIWCLGSGVVLKCIDSWPLPSCFYFLF